MEPKKLQRLNEICDTVAEHLQHERGDDYDLTVAYELGVADSYADTIARARSESKRIVMIFNINDENIEILIRWYLEDTVTPSEEVPF